jgi:hypothetical protein
MVTAVGAIEIAGRAARPFCCRPPPPPNRLRRRRHLFPCPSSQTAACRPRPLLRLTSETRRAESASPESCPILHASENPLPERNAHALGARAVSKRSQIAKTRLGPAQFAYLLGAQLQNFRNHSKPFVFRGWLLALCLAGSGLLSPGTDLVVRCRVTRKVCVWRLISA